MAWKGVATGGGIVNPVPLSKEAIDQVFEEAVHQGDYLTGLYKLAIPQWDAVHKVKGYPAINNETWKYICRKAMAFDKEHHPQVLAGGAWINKGFSAGETVPEWQADLSSVTLEMLEQGEEG